MLNLRTRLSQALALALTLSLTLALSACGGGTDRTKAHVRLANASSGYSALALTVDGSTIAAGVAAGTSTDYADASRGTQDLDISSPSSATVLSTRSASLGKDTYYTLLAYGKAGALATQLLEETQSTPSSGKALVRVINTATDAGSLDVYLTGANDTLLQSAPLQSAAAFGTLGSFVTINSGSWRLRITAANNASDLRLDVPNLSFGSQDVMTLVITPGRSGLLVNGLLLTQQGGVAVAANTQARIRVAAGISGNPVVSASVAGTNLLSSAVVPALTDYALVTAGAVTPVVTVNGGTALSFSAVPTLVAGGDYTLVVHGAPGSAAASILADDNTLPSDSSKAKLRMVNAAAGVLTLKVGLVVKASGVAAGTASGYVAADATTTGTVQVSSADLLLNYNATDLSFAANGVYTLFMLGSSSAPVGQLNRDR
jgi:hypothetical protein